MKRVLLLGIAVVCAGACGDDDTNTNPTTDGGMDATTMMDGSKQEDGTVPVPDAAVDATTDGSVELPEEDDTLHTELALNLDDATGVAKITVRDDGDGMTWYYVPSDATKVERADGTEVLTSKDPENPRHLRIPLNQAEETLTFRYAFDDTLTAKGWDEEIGFSIIWPNYCGNLFPCDPHPKDGMTFSANLTYSGERTLVYPQSIESQGPAYMFGIALVDLEKQELGTTTAGTKVAAWIPTGASDEIKNSTKDLVTHMDFYEKTYGAYIYGGEVGSVFVANNDVGIGGMEHHPYWHVVEGAWVNDPSVHTHEAAHGWFGNGVRIECWEDFVLSEGVVSYMTARAYSSTGGEEGQKEIFDGYSAGLDTWIDRIPDGVAWINDSCDPDVQFDESDLWTPFPYVAGALFFKAVAEKSSYEKVDAALASFFAANKETAKRMQDLIDHMEAELALDLSAEVEGWLLTPGRPDAE